MAESATAKSELILVADDIPANVELLLDQLNSLGYETTTAVDGPSAVAAAFEKHPDLCILDVAMPAGDLGVDDRSTGFEVCRRIKRDPRTSRIPVIFVTALNDTSDRVRGIEAGGDDFLTKPHNRLVDRKSTRLNSSHLVISYAVFCLNKKITVSNSWRVMHPLKVSTLNGTGSTPSPTAAPAVCRTGPWSVTPTTNCAVKSLSVRFSHS